MCAAEQMTGVAMAEDKLKNLKSFSRSVRNVQLLSELGESVQQYEATVIRSRDVDQSVINI
jgi:virulence-associated protein VapD